MFNKSKIILGIGVMVISTFGFADAKSDYELAMENAKNNKIEEGVKLLESVTKTKNNVYVAKANYQLGTYYLSQKNLDLAKSYFIKATTDKKDDSKEVLDSLVNLSNIYYNEKNVDLAEKTILDMETRTQGKNAQVLSYIGSFYLTGKSDYVKSESYYKRASDLEPQNLRYKADLIQLYEAKKDQQAVTRTISELKEINSQVSNRDLGVYFAQYGNIDLANKYLLKAVNEDKNNDAILNLGIFYYNIDKKDEGKKQIAKAQSLGVKGANEAMEQIKKLEANSNK